MKEKARESYDEHRRSVDEQLWQAWVQKNRAKDQRQVAEWRRRGIRHRPGGSSSADLFSSLHFVH
jgi:hypothetical protein